MARGPRGVPAGGFSLAGIAVSLGGREVLADVSLDVAAGEMIALIGPSGAGKTTLLRLLNGAAVPTRGRVVVEGRDLSRLAGADLRAQRTRIGFVHQDLRLVPNLRVVQNVLSGRLGRLGPLETLRLVLRPRSEDLEEVHGLLEQVGIADLMYQRVDRLSGGQAQRVAIARALFQSPSILLADEPVASVDPARARAVLELLTRLACDNGLSLCVSLHDATLVREFLPRVVGLRAGRLVLDTDTGGLDSGVLDRVFALDENHEL